MSAVHLRGLHVANKAAVLFGFRGPKDMDTVGYLCVDGGMYDIVDDMLDATRFWMTDTGEKGWAPPDKWVEFFNAEDSLSPWKFHTVAVIS